MISYTTEQSIQFHLKTIPTIILFECNNIQLIQFLDLHLLKTFFVPWVDKYLGTGKCHVLYTHSHLESEHGQSQFQFYTRIKNTLAVTDCIEAFNTFSEFGPSKGHRIHKYYAYCNSAKSLLKYVVFQK